MTSTILVIFAILILVVTFWYVLSTSSKTKDVMSRVAKKNQFGKEIGSYSSIQYVGGHPKLPLSGRCRISLRQRGMVVCVNNMLVSIIKYKDIKAVSVSADTKVDERHRLQNTSVVMLSANVDNVDCEIAFEGQLAGQLASIINDGR